MTMENRKPRLVGLNHIALEVADVDEALRFYGAVFAFDLRGAHRATTIDIGDQFLALAGDQASPRSR
jgi:catechol 2,3-dioxygenase-like lactoylglutathione lyase family enzyme